MHSTQRNDITLQQTEWRRNSLNVKQRWLMNIWADFWRCTRVSAQGGCAVRLFHKELEAYLVAEGLFEDDITEDGQYMTLLAILPI